MTLSNQGDPFYSFGPFRLYPSERELLCDNKHVNLPPKEFDVLVALVEKDGDLVKKEYLMDKCWPDENIGESAMTQAISGLRKVLRRDGLEYIRTVPKHGYRFVAEGFIPDSKKGTGQDEDEEPSIAMSQEPEEISLIEKQGGIPSIQNEDTETRPLNVENTPTRAEATEPVGVTGEDQDEELSAHAEDGVSNPAFSTEVMSKVVGQEPPVGAEASNQPLQSGQSREDEGLAQPEDNAPISTSQTAKAVDQNETPGGTSSAQVNAHPVLLSNRAAGDAPPKIVWVCIFALALFLVLNQGPDARYVIALQIFLILAAFLFLAFSFQRGLTSFSNKPELKEFEDEVMKASGYDDQTDWKNAKNMATTAFKAYQNHWYGVLASWGGLYIVLALGHPPDLSALSQAISSVDPQTITSAFGPDWALRIKNWEGIDRSVAASRIFAALFSNINSLMFALGYMVLSKSTVIETNATVNEKVSQYTSNVPWGWGISVMVVITLIEVVWVSLSSNAVKANVLEGIDWLTGISAGITLALYVGRLQSKFLNPPHSLLIFALYSYAAIQPLYPLINMYPYKYKWVAAAILWTALLLKLLLCSYVIQLFQSGRLLFYFVRVRRTNDKVDEEWKKFQLLVE